MTLTQNLVLRDGDGDSVSLGGGGFGARHLIRGEQAGGAFAFLEHPIAPRTLAAPMHTHRHEDEWSYVLEGEVGFQIGEEIVYAGPGDLVSKPRGVPHAFWNRKDAPARVLELISPPAFASYFEELARLLPPAVPAPDFERLQALQARYALEMDLSSAETISAREGLGRPPA